MSPLRRSTLRGVALTSALCLCGSTAVPARGMTARDLLRKVAQFTDADWAMVQRGQAVAKVLDTDTREIAIAGAVRIRGTRDQLVTRSQDLAVLEGSAAVLDTGRFSQVPAPADLQGVIFEEYSLDLRNCRPGDCHVRLGAEDIARFHKEVNWRGADWRNQSAMVWRGVLARYAAAYLSDGRKALPDYVNKRDTLSVASEVSLLTRDFAFVSSYSPELAAYLHDFGPNPPAGAQQMLYWTREDFGIRPILRISHQVILQVSGSNPSTLIATNQVYADHYLDAGLTVTTALEAPGEPADATRARDFYVISVSRARTRSLSGLLRRFARSTVQSRSRETMRKILASTKTAIESPRP